MATPIRKSTTSALAPKKESSWMCKAGAAKYMKNRKEVKTGGGIKLTILFPSSQLKTRHSKVCLISLQDSMNQKQLHRTSSQRRSWRASTESKFGLGRSLSSSPDEFKSRCGFGSSPEWRSVELSSRCLELLPSLCDGRGWWGWKKKGEIEEFIRGRE